MSMPLHRLDEYRHKRLEPFAANTIGCLPQQDQRLTRRFVVNPASWARRRSLAWCPLPQQALRVLAVHLCYRNELVEDPALFQTAAPRVSTRYGCHKFVTRCHAHLPHVRLCSLTSKRSKSDEATGLFWAAFQTRQCAGSATTILAGEVVRQRRSKGGASPRPEIGAGGRRRC